MNLATVKARKLCWNESHPLGLAAFLAPTLSIYAALGMAPLYIVVLVGTLAVALPSRPWREFSPAVMVPLWAFCLFGAVSALWAVDPLQTLRTAAVLMLTFTCGAGLIVQARRLDEDGRRRVGSALAVGMALGLTCLLLEKFTPGLRGLFHQGAPVDANIVRSSLQRAETVMTVLLFPTCAYLWTERRLRMALGFLLVFVVAIYTGTSLASKLALPAGLAVFALYRWRPQWSQGLVICVVCGLIALQPLWSLLPDPQLIMDKTQGLIPNSAHHRLTIWHFGADKTLERPLFGWGLDGARSIPGGDDEIPIYLMDGGDRVRMHEQLMPLHPHNGALQWWLELGAVGAALVAAFSVALVKLASRQPSPSGAVGLSMMVAALVVILVSYGVWQSWWQGTLWLAAAFAAALMPRKSA